MFLKCLCSNFQYRSQFYHLVTRADSFYGQYHRRHGYKLQKSYSLSSIKAFDVAATFIDYTRVIYIYISPYTYYILHISKCMYVIA